MSNTDPIAAEIFFLRARRGILAKKLALKNERDKLRQDVKRMHLELQRKPRDPGRIS